MANLKEIRNRISSVNSTMQITSAMKMVSAAKLKRAQDAITQMRPYAQKLGEILGNLSASLESSDNIYGEIREPNNVLLVAVTSNRGLCGGFNNNVIKQINRLVSEESSNVGILPIGKKANDAFKNSDNLNNFGIFSEGLEGLWDDLSFENVGQVASKLMEAYVEGTVDKIVVVYNRFKNVGVQIITSEQFLPINPTEVEADSESSNIDYIFEPSKEEIILDLIPKSLKVQLYKAMLDSNAAEHGARMTAMHKATDNASELKKDLSLSYNKARQAAITNEILEIVGGAEALN